MPEFTKCQGATLLQSLSAAARASLRHYEVVAVLAPFAGRLPLHPDARVPKSMAWVAVTDWSLVVVSLQPASVLLELPLALAAHVAMEPVLDAGDVVRGDRGAAQRITVNPSQQQQQCQEQGVNVKQQQAGDAMLAALRQQLQEEQLPRHQLTQQQQQHTTPPWQQQGLQTVPEGGTVAQQQQPAGATRTSTNMHPVHVQHISSSGGPFDAAAGGTGSSCNSSMQAHAASGLLEPGYCLQLMTVERHSQLWFHLQRAWVGAQMRTALAAAGAPGLRSWAPRRAPAAAPSVAAVAAAAAAQQQQRRQSQVDILVLPAGSEPSFVRQRCSSSTLGTQAHTSFFSSGRASLQVPAPGSCAASKRRASSPMGSPPGSWRPPQSPPMASASRPQTAPDAAARSSLRVMSTGQLPWHGKWRAALFGASRPPSAGAGGGADNSGSWPRTPSSPPSTARGSWRPFTSGQQRVLREFMAEGAEVVTEPTASAARQLLWEAADALLSPCSLFDAGDVAVLQRMMLELASASREQAAALQQAFFESSEVLSFIVARLTSWGSLMALFPEDLPCIQNPAQPCSIEAWSGRPVTWSTWLVYPGRPQSLLKTLGLGQHTPICLRSALKAAAQVAERHQAAARAWAQPGAAGTTSSSTSGTPAAYYADPLNLSPLSETPYAFVAAARRFLCEHSSSSSGSGGMASSSDGGALASGIRRAFGYDYVDSAAADTSYDLATQGTLAEATNVLRWERLVGRLAARIAHRKAALLLQWLQLHLAFTEGCSSRGLWLSGKALTPDPAASQAAGAALPVPWTFRAATQQLVAYLATLHIPSVRASLAAGGSSNEAPPTPQDKEDYLWWTQLPPVGGSSSSSSSPAFVLDSIVGILHELSGIAHQTEQDPGGATGVPAVMEVLRQVPPSCLHPLLRALLLRFICLLAGTAASRGSSSTPEQHPAAAATEQGLTPEACAVLAYRYGSVLLEVLGSVLGCAGQLQDALGVELEHLMAVPQVQAQLMAAAAACSGSGVLVGLNTQLLERVLAAVSTAPPHRPREQHQRARMHDVRCTASVMKVQT